MDPSLNQPAPQVEAEEDEWDTDGFVIPSLTLGESDLTISNGFEVIDPNPPAKTIQEVKIYLGPHGAPPSQVKQHESNSAVRKQRFKQKLREADRKISGTGRENKVETLKQLVGSKVPRATMPKSSLKDWLDPHCHESQFERYRQ